LPGRRPEAPRFALAIGIGACGSEPSDPPGDTGGFRVTSVEPANGATDVAWTATFDATLSAALDPASLAPGSVELRREGALVPAVITYDATGHSIRILAPLLPGVTYQAELGPGLRSVDGDSLAGHTWTVTTRAWGPAPLSGLGELDYFGLALGPSGSVHLFGNGDYRPWSDYGAPYMKYLACASNCADPANWGRMAVDSSYEPFSEGTLVVNGSGRVHLLHVGRRFDSPDLEMRYGTCASDCLDPASWSMATLDVEQRIIGFAQDESGVLHLVTGPAGGNPELRYATCATDCTDPANWPATPIPGIGYVWDEARALQVDRSGGLHLITSFAGAHSYTSCPSNCLSPAQWSTAPVEGAGAWSFSPSLAVDEEGGVHMVFTDPNGVFTYAHCQADCTDPLAWERVGLEEGDHFGSALTVDETGRITALNPVSASGKVRFLSCLADCLNPANWQIAAVGPFDGFEQPLAAHPVLCSAPGAGCAWSTVTGHGR
jgi:hypothetical protein